MRIGKNHKKTVRTALTAFASLAALAMTQKSFAQGGDLCACSVCNWSQEHASLQLIKGSQAYLDYIEPAGGGAATTPASSFVGAQVGTQVVYLEYDSATGAGEYVYSGADRTAIRDGIQAVYSQFNISVTNTAPVSGDFSTITFNEGSPGGLADGIDFRNTNKNDNVVVNIQGLGLAATPANFVPASIGIGAHELGHILGFRHGDSYGTYGTGVTPGNNGNYFPVYPGPAGADETNSNVMASPASVGSGIGDLLTPNSLSARSATKLAYAQVGTPTAEIGGAHGTIGTAQALTLPTISVPNTALPADDLFGELLQADVESVTGAISVGGEIDMYSFDASAGDIINIELMSGNRGFANIIDSIVRVLDGTGTPIDYYGTPATNDDELEGFDSILIDLPILTDDTYFIEVTTFNPADTGNYELYVNRIGIVPEPGSMLVLLGLSAGVLARRRRAA